jgi:hypothetical protein
VSGSERKREIRRRRKRSEKLELFKKRLSTANASEKAVIAAKLRHLTPGAEELITAWGLEDRS